MMKTLPVSLSPTEKIVGWLYWGLQLLVIPVMLPMTVDFFGWPLSETQQNFLYFSLNFVCLTVIMHQFLGQSAKLALQRPFYVLRSALFGYAVYWLSSLAISAAIVYLHPGFANANDTSILEMVADDYTLTAIGTVLLAPVAEELMYRGLLFGSLYNRSRLAAYTVSTLVFAAIHVVGYIGMYDTVTLVLCFVQYIPAGLCLGWAYARSGNILAPILMHIAINQTSILTMR